MNEQEDHKKPPTGREKEEEKKKQNFKIGEGVSIDKLKGRTVSIKYRTAPKSNGSITRKPRLNMPTHNSDIAQLELAKDILVQAITNHHKRSNSKK